MYFDGLISGMELPGLLRYCLTLHPNKERPVPTDVQNPRVRMTAPAALRLRGAEEARDQERGNRVGRVHAPRHLEAVLRGDARDIGCEFTSWKTISISICLAVTLQYLGGGGYTFGASRDGDAPQDDDGHQGVSGLPTFCWTRRPTNVSFVAMHRLMMSYSSRKVYTTFAAVRSSSSMPCMHPAKLVPDVEPLVPIDLEVPGAVVTDNSP